MSDIATSHPGGKSWALVNCSVQIPAAVPIDRLTAGLSTVMRSTSMPSLHSPKREVLIVDDEVQARELLSEFCRAQGYVVATANEGWATLAAIARGPRQFGDIITDLQLPV
jgi:hypothetical protein